MDLYPLTLKIHLPWAFITFSKASLIQPFMPETAEKIAGQLNTTLRDFDRLEEFGLYENGTKVTDTPEILFARLDMKDVLAKEEEIAKAQMAAAGAAAGAETAGQKSDTTKDDASVIDIEPKAEITYDDFAKMQFQVGEIIACEAVKKSKKLLRFELDDGSGTPRQILSGIHEFYEPEQLIGKTVVAILNLPPRKMMGLDSCGMLLSAEKNGALQLLMLDDAIPAGAKLC